MTAKEAMKRAAKTLDETAIVKRIYHAIENAANRGEFKTEVVVPNSDYNQMYQFIDSKLQNDGYRFYYSEFIEKLIIEWGPQQKS
jgi:hypothetical protein